MENKTKKQAIKESLLHWFRLRKAARYANRKFKSEKPKPVYLYLTINETWYSTDCALCYKYFNQIDFYKTKHIEPCIPDHAYGTKSFCGGCPLNTLGLSCFVEGSPWDRISNAANWRIWLTESDNLIGLLWQCLKDAIKEEKAHEELSR